MPDSNGRFLGIQVPALPWENDEPELDTTEPEFDIVWTPDPSLDGAHFEPEGP